MGTGDRNKIRKKWQKLELHNTRSDKKLNGEEREELQFNDMCEPTVIHTII